MTAQGYWGASKAPLPWRSHPPALQDCHTDAERMAWWVSLWQWEGVERRVFRHLLERVDL